VVIKKAYGDTRSRNRCSVATLSLAIVHSYPVPSVMLLVAYYHAYYLEGARNLYTSNARLQSIGHASARCCTFRIPNADNAELCLL
jgi:hypothetical protein